MSVDAWLFDGQSAVRRRAEVEPGEGGLRLIAGSGAEVFVPSDRLTLVETRAEHDVYGHRDIPGWRLGIPRPLPPALEVVLPGRQNYGGWIDRIGLPRALVIGAAVSAAVVFIGLQLPALLAPAVPLSWERRFGEALVGDLGDRVCADPAGQRALDKLAARLSPRSGELKVRVIDLAMVNAAALPGGNIVIFRHLLAEAESPDEVAGVLAHEIAHVENRDVTRALIRQYGFGVILATVGGTTGGNFDRLLAADYSREAETKADGDAIASLQRAGISPLPTARFFERLAKMEEKLGNLGDAFNYISSHPQSTGRRQRFLASARRATAYSPALTKDEWGALQDICFNDPKRRAARERS